MRITWLIGFPLLVLLYENSELSSVSISLSNSYYVPDISISHFLFKFLVAHYKIFFFLILDVLFFIFLFWINSFWGKAGTTINNIVLLSIEVSLNIYSFNTILYKIRVPDKNVTLIFPDDFYWHAQWKFFIINELEKILK